MKQALRLILIWAGLAALPASAHLEGILPLARDDKAAVAQAAASPGRHVFLYFGDHAN